MHPAFHGTLPMTADTRDRTPARRTRRRPAVLALAALTFAAVAQGTAWAAPIISTPEYTASIPVTPTDWSPGVPAGSPNPLTLPKFDPGLGKLLSVTLKLDYSLQNDFHMQFVSPSKLTVSATEAKISIERPDKSVLLSATPEDVTKEATVTGPTFPQEKTFPSLNRTGTTGPLNLTSAADLALFTAAKKGDTIALPAFATSKSTFTSSTGNGNASVNTRAGVGVSVVYTYAPSPVPEPTTFAVLGLGVFGLAASRRVRSRNRV